MAGAGGAAGATGAARTSRSGAGGRGGIGEHHAFDGAVGVVAGARDLRDRQPQLLEIDGIRDGPLHLERRQARA
jgi:hypothetical protein